jgi:hypothetical protein
MNVVRFVTACALSSAALSGKWVGAPVSTAEGGFL